MSPRVHVDKEVKSGTTRTLKTSSVCLQISVANWEDLSRNRLAWRSTVKTGAAMYEANHVTAVKTKREARRSQLCSSLNANTRLPSICLWCQRTFWVRISLIRHLRTKGITRPTLVDDFVSTSAPPSTLTLPSIPRRHPPLPSPPQHLLRWLLPPPPIQTILTHCQATPSPPPTPMMRTRSQPFLIAIVHSSHTSAWSVTCGFIAHRLVNQCPEHPHTLAASAPISLTGLAHSAATWVY
ncbi:hypothetical protein SprV_0100151300 [Sparganum proliferum]